MLEAELRAALTDPHPSVRRAAARALGRIEDKGAAPALRKAMGRSVGYIAWDIAGALARLGDPSGAARLRADLRKLTSARDEFKRKYILHILGELKDPAAAAWGKLIEDRRRMVTPGLRRKALGYLAALGDNKARAELERAVESEAWPARVEAARALSATDPELSRKVLRRALAESTGRSRLSAACQLAAFGDARAAEILIEFLDSADPVVRQKSALALGALPGSPGGSALRRALGDPERRVALAAAVALLRS